MASNKLSIPFDPCQDHFSSDIFSSDIFSSADFRPAVFRLAFFRLAIFRFAYFRLTIFRLGIFSSELFFVCAFFRPYIFSFVYFFVRTFFRFFSAFDAHAAWLHGADFRFVFFHFLELFTMLSIVLHLIVFKTKKKTKRKIEKNQCRIVRGSRWDRLASVPAWRQSTLSIAASLRRSWATS